MAIKFLEHRWQKVLAIVLLVFLFVITVVAYFVNRYWSPILADKVRSTVLTSTDSLYHADFTDADLHIVQGKLVIHNLTLKPDSAVYQRRLRMGTAPNNLYTLKVKRIVFKRIHPLKLYYHKQLDIGQIILSEPELQVSYQLNQKADTSQYQVNAWQRIKSILKSAHIGEVMLNDVKFMYKDYSGNKLNISELKEMNLLAKDLLIDSTTQTDASRLFYFKDIQLELNNFSRPTDNGLYTYKIKQLLYSTLTSKLYATGVGLIPAADSLFLKRKIRTWFSFDTDTLKLNGFDFKKYNKFRLLNAGHLLLKRGNFTVFTNPGAQAKKGDRLITFPNVAIQQLKSKFTLDTVELNRIHITYKGYGRKSHKQGIISYNNTRGHIYNITNEPDALKKNNITRVHLNSYLMDAGPLEAEFTFNLTDSARSYTYKGWVGTMDLEMLNKAVIPFGLVEIKSGWLDKLSFDFKADRYAAKGKVSFLYHNLKVHILKMDTVTQKYRHRAIASLLANALIVKRNNPDEPGDEPRTFNINYVRQPDTPFFKSVWKTLGIGIKASAGYDDATEKEVKQHIARHLADKERRRVNKALRQKRRAIRKGRKN
ncbi:hypothetical protein ACFQ3S_17005 [Mucilaginibacter terrae]|uniref:hypothetical protein n=1 Tax=Mucilaginibacter terrae TaxID=1955052 RepID=UPI00362AF5E7